MATDPTPAGLDPIAAAWIRQHVLPDGYLRNSGPIDTCSCQGRCGHCAAGEHDRCAVRQWQGVDPAARRRPIDAVPEAHIVGRDWMVATTGDPRDRVSAEVWRTGRPCRYRCVCDCPPELHPGLPAATRPPRDVGGNATAALQGAASAQDRRVDQPTLFDLEVDHA